MCYLIINKQFLLRGWTGLEHGVTDSKSGYTAFFPENVYDTLKLCNGRFKDNSPLFMGARKDQKNAPDVNINSAAAEAAEPMRHLKAAGSTFWHRTRKAAFSIKADITTEQRNL